LAHLHRGRYPVGTEAIKGINRRPLDIDADKAVDDVLSTFSYVRVSETAMPKLRFCVVALTVIFAGLVAGMIPASLVTMAQWEPQSCWHPGLERNIGIAEQACQ